MFHPPPAHLSYPEPLGKYLSLLLPRQWTLGQGTAPIKSTNRKKISSIMKRHFMPVGHERHCFLHTFSRTLYYISIVDFYLWPFPDNPSGLGRVWSQFLISQWSAPSWKAVVLKQAPTPQTLFPQSLIILAWELHRLLVGADALLPLLLLSQSICPGCHPQLKSVKILPEGRLRFVRA